MDSQKSTQRAKMEPCLTCDGIVRRRNDCLVCLLCSDEPGVIGRLEAEIKAKNKGAFLANRLDEIVDPWDEIFKFVLREGPETIARKQTKLSEEIKLRNNRIDELKQQTEKEVAGKLSVLAKGSSRAQYLAMSEDRDSLIETRFGELKQEDGVLKKAVGKVRDLGENITVMREQLKDIRKKRAEHLKQIEESMTKEDGAEEVAA